MRTTLVGGLVGRALQVLGLNGVPVTGYFVAGWSQGTALATYWVESVLVIFLVSLRIVLHRRWTRKAGHFRVLALSQQKLERERPLGSGSFLSGYLGVAIPFTAAHGLFLGLLLFLFLPQAFGPAAAVSLVDLRAGVIGVAIFLLLGLAIDLFRLRERSFRWLELLTERAMGRVFVVHMTIVLGMGAVAFFEAPTGLFAAFAGFKTLFDLNGIFPHRELALQPPRWLRFLDRIKSSHGESFSAYWYRTEKVARKLRQGNERVVGEVVSRN